MLGEDWRHIRERLKGYFDKIFNGNDVKELINLGNLMEDRNHRFVQRIRMTNVKALHQKKFITSSVNTTKYV